MPKKAIEEELKTKGKGNRQDNEVPRRSPRLKAKEDKKRKKSKMSKSKNTSPKKEKEEKVSYPPEKANSAKSWFCSVNWEKVMGNNKGKKVGEISKILRTKWDGLTEEKKKKYNEMASKDKVR
jgi:hypothetical protein